jgi:hypothetical protein
MKTVLVKIVFWLMPALGISLIYLSWNFDWFSQITKMVEREKFEKFLNKQVAEFFSDNTVKAQDELKPDSPDLASLQDCLLTVDPKLERVTKERLKNACMETKTLEKEPLDKFFTPLEWQGTVANIGGRVRAIIWDPNDLSDVKNNLLMIVHCGTYFLNIRNVSYSDHKKIIKL